MNRHTSMVISSVFTYKGNVCEFLIASPEEQILSRPKGTNTHAGANSFS